MTDEPIPDPLANLDQALRGLADMAKAVRSYYTALRGEGFEAGEALSIVIAWQAAMVTKPSEDA